MSLTQQNIGVPYTTLTMEDQDNGFVGHLKVSVVHDGSTPYVSVYNVNEDSTRIADFTVAISGDMVQLSANTNTSSHTNLRIYRIALGDHHETVANTNSKIIVTSTNIGSSATTLDQFTKDRHKRCQICDTDKG
jgi:hypothetical protein